MQESISRNLAKFTAGLTYQDLPPEVIERAKTRILDALGAVFSGHDLPWSQMAIKLAMNSRGGATIFGTGMKASVADSVFANAVLSHSVLMEDWAGGTHPSLTIVPAALAVAEEEGLTGRDVITAIVAGYEVLIRVAAGLGGKMHPAFRRVLMLAPIGAATVAGKLFKLNQDQLTHALGQAANFASGLSEGWEEGSMEMMSHAGIGSRNGIIVALLARMGATAAEATMEGRNGFYMAFSDHTGDAEAAAACLGKKFLIMDVLAKRYPACGSHQAGTDICLALREQHNIEAGEIERVQETVMPRFVFDAGYYSYAGPFANPFQAQMSGKFCLAAALLGKPVTSPPFFARHYADPEILALVGKVDMVGEKGRKTFQPRVEIFMKNGDKYVMDEDRSPRFIPTREFTESKFRSLASNILGEARVNKVIATVMELEKIYDINNLTDILRK